MTALALFLLSIVGAAMFTSASPQPASAATCPANAPKDKPCIGDAPKSTCDPALPKTVCSQGVNCSGPDCGLLAKYASPIITFLSASAALVSTISIVVGGIQYASSADDPGKVAAAKSRIYNSILGLMGFLFLWAFLQWLVPGGVF